MTLLVRQRGLSLIELGPAVERALMSGGVIILIVAAGGAFRRDDKKSRYRRCDDRVVR